MVENLMISYPNLPEYLVFTNLEEAKSIEISNIYINDTKEIKTEEVEILNG